MVKGDSLFVGGQLLGHLNARVLVSEADQGYDLQHDGGTGQPAAATQTETETEKLN